MRFVVAPRRPVGRAARNAGSREVSNVQAHLVIVAVDHALVIRDGGSVARATFCQRLTSFPLVDQGVVYLH